MSEVLVVFTKSTNCAFTKNCLILEAKEIISFIRRGIVLIVNWHNSTRFYYYYYHTTTYLLLFTTTNLQPTTYGLGNRAFLGVHLSRYNSKSINC
jgi:hypothetical protein